MNTVAVVEGWAGGPKLSRKFRQQLTEKGFRISKNLKDADVIFAHSTGCYLLPANTKAKLIIAMDPPYWPGRAIMGRWLDLMRTDTTLLKSGAGASGFISKKLWETYYILTRPRFSWSVLTNQSDLSFLPKHQNTKIILLRNKNDEFCSPVIAERIKEYKNVRYIEVAGNHEDYYIHPKPYIELLVKESKQWNG